jgi:hypothetical protein
MALKQRARVSHKENTAKWPKFEWDSSYYASTLPQSGHMAPQLVEALCYKLIPDEVTGIFN